ncbi:MAG TPA: hypothetical protein VGM53_30920 [Streptosporangiaceae bacterium]
MRDNVTISYRGASYEIGRGPHFYGIWVVGAPQPQPVEWWPETPEGWSSAWARFTGIEAPGTIAAVRPAASGATRPASAWAPGPGPAAQTFAPAGPATQAFAPAGPATQPGQEFDPAGPTTQPGQAFASGPDTQPGQAFAPAGPTTQPGRAFVSGPAYPPGGPAAQPTMAPTPIGHPAALAAQPGAQPAQPKAGVRAGLQGLAAAGLLVIGVAFGIASIFPNYLFGASLGSDAANLWPHVIYLVAWAGGAFLILRGGAQLRMGALLAAGTSIVTFGLFVSDAGSAIAYGSNAGRGAGLVLGLIGWLACALGSGLAVRLRQRGRPAPTGPQAFAARHLMTVLAALAALGTAITFAPSWDGYTLSAEGVSRYVELGDAFKNPGWVITGDVLAMIALVLAVVLAALWRPVREGAWLLAGAVIPMAAQAISAMIQIGEPTLPSQFGFSQAQAQQIGLTITSSLTPAFWLFCAFVVVLMIGCGWLLLSSRATALDTPPPRGQAPYGPAGPGPYNWPHPFTGGSPQTAPEAQASPAQTETPQSLGTAQPDAPENSGLDILDSPDTEPDILDSHDSPQNNTETTNAETTNAEKPDTPATLDTPEPGTKD